MSPSVSAYAINVGPKPGESWNCNAKLKPMRSLACNTLEMLQEMRTSNELLDEAVCALLEQRESGEVPMLFEPVKERKH